MANFDHDDYAGIILNFIKDAVRALTDPVALLIGELFTSLRAGFISERLDPPQDPLNLFLRNGTEVFSN